jgi:hypothetical protein
LRSLGRITNDKENDVHGGDKEVENQENGDDDEEEDDLENCDKEVGIQENSDD